MRSVTVSHSFRSDTLTQALRVVLGGKGIKMDLVCLACGVTYEGAGRYCPTCLALPHTERILLTHLAYIKEALQAIYGELCNK